MEVPEGQPCVRVGRVQLEGLAVGPRGLLEVLGDGLSPPCLPPGLQLEHPSLVEGVVGIPGVAGPRLAECLRRPREAPARVAPVLQLEGRLGGCTRLRLAQDRWRSGARSMACRKAASAARTLGPGSSPRADR